MARRTRSSFGRGDVPAARSFLDSVYSSGGIRRGRGSRAPSDLSDRYVLRIANALRRQAEAGQPLSLQVARRESVESAAAGRKVREHPRVTVKGGIRRREYSGRSTRYVERRAEGDAAAGEVIQVTALGVPRLSYLRKARDKRGRRGEPEAPVAPSWRTVYTGPADGLGDLDARLDEMFEDVEAVEYRTEAEGPARSHHPVGIGATRR